MNYTKSNVKELSEWYDDRPPELSVEINHPSGYTFYIAVDNTAIPVYFNKEKNFGKGGTRCSTSLSRSTIEDLAERMSKKNALPGRNGLYGGAKSGIKPPKSWSEKRLSDSVIFDFAEATWKFHAKNGGSWGGSGCDINFQEDSVEKYLTYVLNHLSEDIRVATGRPSNEEYKGAAYDENGAAGKGVAKATDTVIKKISENPELFPEQPVERGSVAIQGLGAMGSAVLECLNKMGYDIVAVSDITLGCTVFNKQGLDPKNVMSAHRDENSDNLDGEKRDIEDVLYVDCDILVPAATSDVIDKNANEVEASIVVEAANGPLTAYAKNELYNSGVLVIPGESANFGGSVAASVELDPSINNDVVEESLRRTDLFVENHTEELLSKFTRMGGFDNGVSPHYITDGMAIERIVKAMIDRGDEVPEYIRETITE